MKTRTEDIPSQEVMPQKFLLWSTLLAVAFAWIFWDFLQRQFWFAVEQQADWGHTLVIPFIAGYFVWLCKDKLLREPFQRAWLGLIPVILGLAWYSLCALGPTAMHHHNLMGAGVASTFAGLVLFLFGWRAMRYLWFPLLYLFVFALTISDRFMEVITFELQDIASVGSYYGLSFLGLDVTRAGNTLEIFYDGNTYPLNIAEACSGMRMLMAFFALGVAMAYTSLNYVWQQIILVVLAIPTAVFVNILRVMTLGLLSIADSGFAAGDFHTFVGTLWLIPAFLIYLGIVWVLKNLLIEEEEEFEEEEQVQNNIRFTGSAVSGFVVAVVLLASSAVAFQFGVSSLNVYLHKEAVFPRKNFSLLPIQLEGWTRVGEDIRFDKAGVEALGTDLYLSRTYVSTNRSMPAVQLHVAYYTGQVDAVPHVPDRCMVAGGFVPLTSEPMTLPLDIDQSTWSEDESESLGGIPYRIIDEEEEIIRLPFGEFELRTTQFSHPQIGTDRVFAGYFFVANGKTTAYPERIRLLAFDRSSQYAYYCKIQFTIRGDRDFTTEQFVEIVSTFTSEMLPEIMECLPDWAELNASTNQMNQES
ncbi:MAG TPA: exosortase [Phycisphaerales bacterium]|nr:exosortase [Phycisphaerales bacterium]